MPDIVNFCVINVTKHSQLKRLNLSLIFFLSTLTVLAQSIEGEVLDKYKQSIREANIVNINSKAHIHSNEYGKFTLENSAVGDSLRISYLGFETQIHVIQSLSEPIRIILLEKAVSLDEIFISPRINALHVLTDIDIQVNPVNSSQEVLRKVPGLFIGQHAGGGKSEQIFLRGFDIDHGTDINLSVDGLPVNMVSHAHGQGYADFHFVIPETVNKIDFGKGPYNSDKGNFATAGYVDFETKKRLDHSSINLEFGQFDSYRLLGMFNLLENEEQNKTFLEKI